MTTGMDWRAQVGRTWAENFTLTDRSFAGLTARLLERVEACLGDCVLDVGCGAGELSLAIAALRPQSRVIGLDVSSELLDAARVRAGRTQDGAPLSNVEFVLGDAGAWTREGFAPDTIVSRHGVMFFEDPTGAFAHLRDTSTHGASLVFSCFREPGANPWASTTARLLGLPPSADPYAPGPFAFADENHVRSILSSAGWGDIAFEPVDFAYIAGKGADPVADALQFLRRIGPAAQALRALEGKAREDAETKLRGWLSEHRHDDLVTFDGAAWIVSARNG